ncbi:thiol reductant ABC exporter subunit CydD [Marinobacter orientalis]|uniref:Thiol reductant ABC exporter subunit CydD n=1 Tax=Marinobacter orientalis TaxID=1928859 RepID=A0A7Y0RCE2_9GAMM|nr:thiol reductant ABC exporter subunit CydD [Marinobacter orientalis]NMT63659.1 thiol reductant ABC exporter subunit CydD [Marinobacter orientalis]TGX49774.1 thiol reductant ABC exporter subunit CydD [Marinobacter orientalis]
MPEQAATRRWLSSLAVHSRLLILATISAGVVVGLATIVQMVFLARIVHQGIVTEVPVEELSLLFTGVVAAIVIRGVAQGLQARFAARCSRKVRSEVRHQINRCWQATGPVAMGQISAGTLAREWLDHTDALHGYFARFLPQMILAVIVPLLVLVVVFSLDWLAGIFLLLSAPLIPLFMALVGMGAEKLNQQHFRTIGRLSGQFLDKVRGLTTLQLFGQTEPAAETLRQRSDEYRRVTMKTLRVAFLSSAVLEFFSSVAIAVVAIYIGFGLLGYISYGPAEDLTLFSGLLVLLLAPEFFQPLRLLSQHYHDRAAAIGAGSEIAARLQDADRAGPAAHRISQQRQSPDRIAVQHLTLAYDADRPVLDQVSLEIDRGDVIALTGPSGGGKSSLLYLLAGFMQPDQGSISIFGTAPGEVAFGWLGQSPFLVHGTWADNLRLTTPDATDIAIETALHQVGLGSLLRSRKRGIYSKISEDGQGLSGGQARRLSLARVFVADYDLILLDEPTAGLDSDSEIYIIEALRKLALAGKTLIFATHHQALLTLANRTLLVTAGGVHDA